MSDQPAHPSSDSSYQPTLSIPQIHITTHDPSTFQSTFHSTSAPASWDIYHPNAFAMSTIYSTNNTSLSSTGLKDTNDITEHLSLLPQLSTSVVNPNGSVFRIVDMAPGHESPMHRTVSVDYGVVIEGEVELELDSSKPGEDKVKLMKRGDVVVQRGTMHLWRNRSKTEWCRMMFVLLGVAEVKVGERRLQEEFLGGMPSSLSKESS